MDLLETHHAIQRRNLAKEMHDDFGQLLSAMKLDLTLLNRATAEDAHAQTHVLHLLKLVDTMMTSVRRVISEQPPKILEEAGLAAAVEQLVDSFRGTQATRVVLDVTLPRLPLPMHLQQTIYRILQESLGNSIRHAEASIVRLSLGYDAASIRIVVADNGRGAAPTDLKKPDSVGLTWMRERVDTAGGVMQLDSDTKTGTQIHIRLPYDRPGTV